MATEAAAAAVVVVVSDHSTNPEEEKKMDVEVKTIEKESAPLQEVSGDVEKPKVEESQILETPVVAISEEIVEDKQIEPPVVEEVKKIEETPVVDVSTETDSKVPEDTNAEPNTPSVPEPVAEGVKTELEEPQATKPVEEQPKIVDAPEPVVEAIKEKEEQVEVSPAKESEAVVEKDVEIPVVETKSEELPKPEEQPKIVDVPETPVEEVNDVKAETKEEEVPEPVPEVEEKAEEKPEVKEVENSVVESEKEVPKPVPEVEEKPTEQSEVVKHVEGVSEEVEAKEKAETETAKDEEKSAEGKVEEANSSKEDQTPKEEPLATDQATSIKEPTEVIPKGEEVESPPKNAPEKSTDFDIKEKEPSSANVVEGSPKVEVEDSGNVEAENVKTEEVGDKIAVPEQATQPEPTKVEEAIIAASTPEVVEKSFEGEVTSRDIEMVAENGKEDQVKDTVTSDGTEKDGEVGAKVEEVITTAKEAVAEPEKEEAEKKGEQSVQLGAMLEKEREVGEIANPEPAKEGGDDSKITEDPPKEEVAATKPPHKPSSNIMSKVKQSLVKVKKAIVGKSPSSKSLSTETKGDVEVK